MPDQIGGVLDDDRGRDRPSAQRMELSPRKFARLFRSEVGMTPAAWVEAARVTAARALLEEGRDTPKQVAARCGFADADVLRRAFARHVGVTPAEYRKRARAAVLKPAFGKRNWPKHKASAKFEQGGFTSRRRKG